MATTTTTTRLLHHLALFLLVVQFLFADAVVLPKTKNHAALKHRSSSSTTTTYIVHANHLAKPPHFATLDHWYTSMVASHSPRAGADDYSTRLLYTYDTVMHGFAVRLTADEARRMASAAGVNAVHEDRQLHLLTTRTPGFLGLDPAFGAWRDTDSGDGVIIGFVDTGIWPESPSFSDRGLGPVRSSWKGRCVDAHDFNASLCNNKLVGAKVFTADGDDDEAATRGLRLASPRDTDGHGTHVASIAAGAEVRDTGFGMFARGTARGVAPKARVATYKVPGITMAGTAAAVDAAVKDGVDILSLSIGDPDAKPYYMDTFAVALFGAERKGVSVVLAGGNDGPLASTVLNSAPWMTTVGAATADRMFPARIHLGGGNVLTGQSLYQLSHLKSNMSSTMRPLRLSSCLEHDLTPAKINGTILVCLGGQGPRANRIRDAGGAGVVVVDTTGWWLGTLVSYVDADLPLVVVSLTAGQKITNYMASSQAPVGSFTFACDTVIGEDRAPLVTGFSSRGPNPLAAELLKPDLVAPGQDVLGAWRGDYKLDSGTSMSCPHVAGVAALIRKKHGDWTPAMIRSALITTAGTLDNTDRDIVDNAVFTARLGGTAATPFATGAGHVRPQLALDPGLVYDAGARDYVDFLCALNYTAEQMRLFDPEFVKCTRTLAAGPADLNYPSFVVVFANGSNMRTLTRTLTKVSEEAEMYHVTVVAPEQVKVTVTPTTLEFKEYMETRSYSVEFGYEAGGNREAGEGWDFGHISWANEKHQIRSPVAFQWKN